MRLVTAEEMRMLDQAATKEFNIPSIVLMENAGNALLSRAQEMIGTVEGKKVVIFVGGGNNGGDGLVLARRLHNKGCDVRLFLTSNPDHFQGDALTSWSSVVKLGINSQWISDERRLDVLRVTLWSCDLIVDAIFGTGLNDAVKGIIAQIIQVINESAKPVLACDIPSGLCSYRGIPLGAAVEATQTVTFAYCKPGLVMPGANAYVGKLTVADISIPKELEDQIPVRRDLVDVNFCKHWIHPRPIDSHKGKFGHILMLAGSELMPGAAVLAATAAIRSGVGLLTAAIPEPCRMAFTAGLPEAMFAEPTDAESLVKKPANCFLIGPGLGRNSEAVQLVYRLLEILEKPAVLDADALYAVAQNKEKMKELFSKSREPFIITPHPGEMSLLTGKTVAQIQNNRIDIALEFALQYQVVVVLKGAGTVIATPTGRLFINSTGNPGMSTGGTGDVLAGVIAGLLAQGLPAAIAAAVGVWIHGRAGDIAAESLHQFSLKAGDLLATIPFAFREITG